MEAVVDAIPFPILVIGRDLHIRAANESARHVFGDGLVGRHHVAIIRQPTLLDAIEAVRADGQAKEATYLATEARKDVTWTGHILPLIDGSGVVLTLEDRTAKEEAGQMRRDFVANVSHELKTPLTALMGFIETIKHAAKDDPAAQQRFLEIMEREALRMNRLVTDLMSLNRLESQERQRPSSRLDLSAQIKGVLRVLSSVAEKHDVSVTATGIDDEISILGDPDQIAQIVTNLVENAIKYSGAGRNVTIALEKVDHHPLVLAPAAILTVQDTGDGIPEELIPRLTERFFRIDDHRSRAMGGTGLGLAIVKHIVNRHRGRLRIRSEMGQGSEFTVILPREIDTEA